MVAFRVIDPHGRVVATRDFDSARGCARMVCRLHRQRRAGLAHRGQRRRAMGTLRRHRRHSPASRAELTRRAGKVLDCDDLIAEVTSAADVDTAKPKPDIIEVALERAGVPADRAVFVGDAICDAEAYARGRNKHRGAQRRSIARRARKRRCSHGFRECRRPGEAYRRDPDHAAGRHRAVMQGKGPVRYRTGPLLPAKLLVGLLAFF
jgi:hypothetical protein